MKKIPGFIFLLFVLFGCGKVEEEKCVFTPDITSIEMNLTVEQFEDLLINVRSKKQLVGLFTRQPLIRDYIFRRTAYPGDSAFINEIFNRVTNPHFDSLLIETRKAFGDLTELRTQFTEAFTNLKFYYPDFVPPKIKTLISGLDTDLFVSDSLVIVSLDFYLGSGAKYRPDIYEYLLRQYEKQNIVPS